MRVLYPDDSPSAGPALCFAQGILSGGVFARLIWHGVFAGSETPWEAFPILAIQFT